MLFPKALRPGATVGLVCASSPITPEQKERCVQALEAMGFRVKCAENLNTRYGGFMAGEGPYRAALVNAMFADPQVDAILCARGGDGAGRAVPYLDPDLIRANPKPFVGYSDITAFHLVLNQQCGLGTWHGPMASSNMIHGLTEEEKRSLWESLTLSDCDFICPDGSPLRTLKPGRAEGIVTGGNLSLVCASMGTPYEIETEGRLLFLEDVHESGARLDRMIWQLRNAGKLSQCAGLLLGQFTECENGYDPSYTWLDSFREALSGIDIPVMYGLESGHGSPMMTIPLGALGRMDTEAATLTFHMDRMK